MHIFLLILDPRLNTPLFSSKRLKFFTCIVCPIQLVPSSPFLFFFPFFFPFWLRLTRFLKLLRITHNPLLLTSISKNLFSFSHQQQDMYHLWTPFLLFFLPFFPKPVLLYWLLLFLMNQLQPLIYLLHFHFFIIRVYLYPDIFVLIFYEWYSNQMMEYSKNFPSFLLTPSSSLN